jgi:hypothetical protein
VTQPLAAFLGPLRLSPLRGASAGNPVNGYRLALGQGGRFASLTPAEFSMSWQVDDASYHVAFSAPVGSSLLEASQNPVRRWGESAPIRAALKRVGPASFVLVALPSALGMSPTSPAATMTSALVLSAGRSGEAGYASVEAPVSLLSAELESMVQQ